MTYVRIESLTYCPVYSLPESIGEKIVNVEKLLLEYEDACERVELERRKYGEKLELSTLVEKRQ